MNLYVVACVKHFGKYPDKPSVGTLLETFDRDLAIKTCRDSNRLEKDRFAVYIFEPTMTLGAFNPEEDLES